MVYTGFFKARIVCINPDAEWLTEIMEEQVDEPVYNWEKNDVRFAKLDIFLEDSRDRLFKYTINLEDDELISRTDSYMYINCIGDTQWVKSENDLWENFKYFTKVTEWSKDNRPVSKDIVGEKKFRVAKKGEQDLMNFIRNIEEFNPYDPEVNMFLDLNKVFEGNITSIEKLILKTKDFHICAFAYIDKQLKQCIWKEFMPVHFIKDVSSEMNISNQFKRAYATWYKNATGDYGMDGYYTLDKLKEEVPEVKDITQTNLEY